MEAIRNLLAKLMVVVSSEKGQTVIEYILVIVLIALVLLLAFTGAGVEVAVTDRATDLANEISPD